MLSSPFMLVLRDRARATHTSSPARHLLVFCLQMYARQKTGIAPEYVRFGTNDMSVPGDAPFYILRPETVESFYYLSVLTGDPIYRVSLTGSRDVVSLLQS